VTTLTLVAVGLILFPVMAGLVPAIQVGPKH
jgi:hypothetical protein